MEFIKRICTEGQAIMEKRELTRCRDARWRFFPCITGISPI